MHYTMYLQHRMKLQLMSLLAKFVEGNYSVEEESREDFQELEEFPGYAEINEDVTTINTRSIDQIIN